MKTDCVMYVLCGREERCNGLKELLCADGDCCFYKKATPKNKQEYDEAMAAIKKGGKKHE